MTSSAALLALTLAGTAPQAAAPLAQPDPAPVAAPVPPPALPDPVAAEPVPVKAAEPGEIVVTARQGPPPGDPAERINMVSFEAMQGVDQALVGPVSQGYEKGVPKPLRQGLRNALNNLSEPVNFVNYLLQLKPGKALRTLGRFTINSTVGVAGLVDLASRKPIGLPYRRNGFANTFGYYGIGQGPYMFLPLIGPTTARDLTGRMLDLSFLPTLGGAPFNTPYYSLGTGTVRSLDDRVEFDETLRKLRNDCPDFYASERQWYLATRKADIEDLHGRHVDMATLLPECLQPEAPAAPPPAAAP
ncbi:VacJ family lipoprotein [Novosphingobium sp.]|uniref:MlaA family lipoprotein n=1 Tax=Novosphingobium sp. TaxID=1874826 RepID=UPI0035B3A4BE